MERHVKILLLEDSPDDVDLVAPQLRQGGINFTLKTVKKKEEFEKALGEFHPDIILSDHSLPQCNSIEAMILWKKIQSRHFATIPFILVMGSVSDEFAVHSIKSGADDYLLKDRLKRLTPARSGAHWKRQRWKGNIALLLAQTTLMKEFMFTLKSIALHVVNDTVSRSKIHLKEMAAVDQPWRA